MLCLHVAGGVHNGEYVSWLYCYDPVMDVWARKQDMNTKRAIHALAGMNDRLYAIGGNHLKGKHTFIYGNKRGQYFFLPSCRHEYGLDYPVQPIVPHSKTFMVHNVKQM